MLISCLLHQSNPRPCSWLQSIHHRGNPWCPFAPCQTLSAMAYPSAGIFPFDAEKPPMASYNFQKTCQCPPRTYKVPRRLPRSSQPWFPALLCCAPLHKASCCLCAVPAQDAVPLDLNKASSPVKLYLLRKALWPLYRTVFSYSFVTVPPPSLSRAK